MKLWTVQASAKIDYAWKECTIVRIMISITWQLQDILKRLHKFLHIHKSFHVLK